MYKISIHWLIKCSMPQHPADTAKFLEFAIDAALFSIVCCYYYMHAALSTSLVIPYFLPSVRPLSRSLLVWYVTLGSLPLCKWQDPHIPIPDRLPGSCQGIPNANLLTLTTANTYCLFYIITGKQSTSATHLSYH